MMMFKIKKVMALPSPININIWWNFGSMLGICLMLQIFTGFILSMSYCPNINMAFSSVIQINNNLSWGWLIRNLHVNGASLFFILMFTHILRGIYFHSFKKKMTWTVGVLILILSMMTSFLGYVLPWGQMSYWGATVITNLMSALPMVGEMLVSWIWGGMSINNSTLNRFFSLHFITPMIIILAVMVHLMLLHESGSNNPIGVSSKLYMVPFNPYFTLKDFVGFMMIFMFLTILSTQNPTLLMDPDNFIEANPMITPPHIKPEWYFLFAYSILRAIPNKLGGVLCLGMSLIILFILPIFKLSLNSMKFNPISQLFFYMFMSSLLILTWTGGSPIEYPFFQLSQISSIMYFMFFLIFPFYSSLLNYSIELMDPMWILS